MGKKSAFNLRNKHYFPPLSQLPWEGKRDQRFCNFFFQPIRRWCLLVEIIERNISPTSGHTNSKAPPVTCRVRDVDGRELRIDLHNGMRPGTVVDDCTRGYTMAIMCPTRHRFQDGGVGVNIDDLSALMVIPVSMNDMMQINDKIRTVRTCAICQRKTRYGCELCQMPYCSVRCQTVSWNTGHRELCQAAHVVRIWRKVDWNNTTLPGFY
ncbi:hypothetical protein BDN72DRAFT_842154 [Pluteus cervinus]|uniref:Uncharacterized protein n=1 Tax=Pluteus cervinus TaxID=181527 RepID=A0ACD3AR43_9AGAR|nr:hypothetical protein BDN72DRAFT_842154 [Pluteus cervinus]